MNGENKELTIQYKNQLQSLNPLIYLLSLTLSFFI